MAADEKVIPPPPPGFNVIPPPPEGFKLQGLPAVSAAGAKSIRSLSDTERFGRAALGTLPMIGGVLGSVTGTAAGGPAGGIAGAGLGQAAGEAWEQNLEVAFGLRDPSAVEPVKILKQAGVGAAMELGGVAVAKPILGALGPSKALTKLDTKEVLATARKHGFNLSPAEITGSPWQKFFQRFSEEHPFGAKLAGVRKAEIQAAGERALEGEANVLGVAQTQLSSGNALQAGLKAAKNEWKEAADKLYGDFKPALYPLEVDTKTVISNLKSSVAGMEKLAAKAPETMAVDSDIAGLLNDFQPVVKSKFGNVSVPGPKLTYGEMKEIRGRVQELTGKALKAGDKRKAAILTQTGRDIRSAMKETEGKLGPDIQAKAEAADKFYREGIELYEESSLARIVEMDPNKVMGAVKLNDVTEIDLMKKALLADYNKGGKEYWDRFRRYYAQKLYKDPEGRMLPDFKALKTNIQGMSDATKEALTTDLKGNVDEAGKQFFDNATKIANALSRVDNLDALSKVPTYTSRVSHDAFLATLGWWFHSKVLAAYATARFFSPYAMGAIINNPKATKFMVEGIEAFGKPGAGDALGAGISNFTRAVELSMEGADLPRLYRAMTEEKRKEAEQGAPAEKQGKQRPDSAGNKALFPNPKSDNQKREYP